MKTFTNFQSRIKGKFIEPSIAAFIVHGPELLMVYIDLVVASLHVPDGICVIFTAL